MHLKNGRSAGNGAYARAASRPKVNFWQGGSTSPENYGLFFACEI
jgi:hypothetical protein